MSIGGECNEILGFCNFSLIHFEKNIQGEEYGSFAVIEDVWSNLYIENMNINNYELNAEILDLYKIKPLL